MAKIVISADNPLEISLVMDLIYCLCEGKEYKLRSITETEIDGTLIRAKSHIVLETEAGLIGKFLKAIEGVAKGKISYVGGNQCSLKIH